MQELNDFVVAHADNIIVICGTKSHAEGPVTENIPSHCQQFKKLQVGKITFSITERDNCCLLKNSEICIISNIVQIEGKTLFMIKKFGTRANFYNVEVTSDVVGVYHCSNLSNTVEAYRINLLDVKAKMYRMPKRRRRTRKNVIEN
jgi:hypothetical protein